MGLNLDTPTFLACLFALIVIVLAIAFLIRSYHTDSSSHAKLAQLAVRMAVLRATSLNTKVMLQINTFEIFVEVYARPLLSLLTDFQALLANQVRSNFLHRATQQMVQSGRDQSHQDWPTHVFAHAVAEFLAWLEIYRVQSQMMQNSARAHEVTKLVMDIKKMLEEHTPIQGRKVEGSMRDEEGDELSHLMQLHTSEVQAIGSVMLVFSNDDATQLSFRVPMAIDEFLRAISVSPPPSDAPYQLQFEWTQSFDHKLQVVLSPLLDELSKLAKLPEGEAPVRRLAIIQVLVCKLIDMLDPGVPWDLGPEYDEGEQRPLVLRDERLTPLVQHLSQAQKEWLSQRPYFQYSDPNLSFPGFRQDLAHVTQEERDVHPELWPGACPPKEPRRRPPRWRKDHPQYSQYRSLESAYGGSMYTGPEAEAALRGRRSLAASAAPSSKLGSGKLTDLDAVGLKGISRTSKVTPTIS